MYIVVIDTVGNGYQSSMNTADKSEQRSGKSDSSTKGDSYDWEEGNQPCKYFSTVINHWISNILSTSVALFLFTFGNIVVS